MMDTISSIVINIISSFLYDGMNGWKEKKQIQNFKDEMTQWVLDFEQKNDGTIITKGVFIGYIENYKVIQKIMRHARYSTTEKYIHINIDPMLEAINLLQKKKTEGTPLAGELPP